MLKNSTIKDMHNLALNKNGKFLSIEYINSQTKYKWQCASGHIWYATSNNIQRGKWCPYCAGLAKLTIEDMHNLAKEHNGKFISSEYINNTTKYNWQCNRGHIWEATPKGMKNGKWCQECYFNSKKFTIEDMNNFAKQKGGKFISKKYIGSMNRHEWMCDDGHVWKATPNSIQQGSWCKQCADNIRKYTINDMQELAKTRGGKFLSSEYINSQTKHVWECAKKHIWESEPNSIQRGQCCPYCTASRGEEICREIISKIFGESFIKCRPKFLLPEKGRGLELDGFCEKLNLVFEYHGLQHFQPVDYFGGEEGFEKTQKRDKLKLELCAKHGVKVIVVPTFSNNFNKLICQHMIECAIIAADVTLPDTWIRAVDLLYPKNP